MPAKPDRTATPSNDLTTQEPGAPTTPLAPLTSGERPSGPPAGHIIDRRVWPVDRRGVSTDSTGLERRRGAGRRLSDFTRSAEEGELTKEQFLFLMAIESFKKSNDRAFPTWTDVLEVIRLLGYRKTMPMELTLRNAEDWRETPNSPSNVRPARWHERAA
jgi:hypothetical protein